MTDVTGGAAFLTGFAVATDGFAWSESAPWEHGYPGRVSEKR